MDLNEAILYLLQVVEKIPQTYIERALEKTDVADDVFVEALDTLKNEVDWEDEEDEDD
jgi:hypothetical protein